MIEWHDERVESASDDMIQAPNIAPIIGGVIDPKAKYFSFRYTACKDPEVYWRLCLFDNEIEDIAKRCVTKVALWKCAKNACRNLFTNKADVCCKCGGSRWPRNPPPTGSTSGPRVE